MRGRLNVPTRKTSLDDMLVSRSAEATALTDIKVYCGEDYLLTFSRMTFRGRRSGTSGTRAKHDHTVDAFRYSMQLAGGSTVTFSANP
jgi:hypothetical protein